MASRVAITPSSTKHFLNQLKFLVPGGAATYWLGTHDEFWHVLHSPSQGWARISAFASLAFGCATVILFLYVLLIPWLKGVQPNYRTWRESGVLSSVIPALTASIVAGWLSLVFTLGEWSKLGYLEGVFGASGLYMLIFGILGLIPAPKPHRQQ